MNNHVHIRTSDGKIKSVVFDGFKCSFEIDAWVTHSGYHVACTSEEIWGWNPVHKCTRSSENIAAITDSAILTTDGSIYSVWYTDDGIFVEDEFYTHEIKLNIYNVLKVLYRPTRCGLSRESIFLVETDSGTKQINHSSYGVEVSDPDNYSFKKYIEVKIHENIASYGKTSYQLKDGEEFITTRHVKRAC